MVKSYILFLVGFFAIHISFAQISPIPTLSAGWQRIYVKDVGSFDLPPSMELQKGKYKKFVDKIKHINGIDASQVTAQQKGLNSLDEKSFDKYARVMLETTFGSNGDFLRLDFNVIDYTQSDIKSLDLVYKDQLTQSFEGTGLKLVEWYPLVVEKVNGMSCIHLSYKRRLHEKPVVMVHMYIFFNNDRSHTLILSYRLSEEKYWKSDLVKVLKSFRITNIL